MSSQLPKLTLVLAATVGIVVAARQLIAGARSAPPLTSTVSHAGQPVTSMMRDLIFAHDRLLAVESLPGGERVVEIDFRAGTVIRAIETAVPRQPFVAAHWRPGELLVAATTTQVFVAGGSSPSAVLLAPLPDAALEVVGVSDTPVGLEVLVVRPPFELRPGAEARSRRTPRLADAQIARWVNGTWAVRPFLMTNGVPAVASVCQAELGSTIAVVDGLCTLTSRELENISLSPTSTHAHHDGKQWIVDVLQQNHPNSTIPRPFVFRFFETPGAPAEHLEIGTAAAETALRWPWLAGGIERGLQVQLWLEQVHEFRVRDRATSSVGRAAVSFGSTRVATLSHQSDAASPVAAWPSRVYAADDPGWDWLWAAPFLARIDAETGSLLDQPSALRRLARFVLDGESDVLQQDRVSRLGRALMRTTPVIVFVIPLILIVVLGALWNSQRRGRSDNLRSFEIPLWFLASFLAVALWGIALARDVAMRL